MNFWKGTAWSSSRKIEIWILRWIGIWFWKWHKSIKKWRFSIRILMHEIRIILLLIEHRQWHRLLEIIIINGWKASFSILKLSLRSFRESKIILRKCWNLLLLFRSFNNLFLSFYIIRFCSFHLRRRRIFFRFKLVSVTFSLSRNLCHDLYWRFLISRSSIRISWGLFKI